MLNRFVASTLPLLLLCAPARAAIVEYDFVGHVVAFDAGPLESRLNPGTTTISNVVTGYLRFDASTVAAAPGVFNLTNASFHVQYPGITLDTTGVTATVSANRDAIVFAADFPTSEFVPVLVASDTISLGFQTFTNNFFSLTALPTIVPPNDHTLGFFYASGGVSHGASTDTDLIVTSSLSAVPEPASIALFATGLGVLALIKRRAATLEP